MAAPTRTCVGCRTRFAQAALHRFVLREDRWVSDGVRRGPGRGTYLCSAPCAERVFKNKRFPGLGTAGRVHFTHQDAAMHE